jgi:hypothetical protein
VYILGRKNFLGFKILNAKLNDESKLKENKGAMQVIHCNRVYLERV